VSVPGKSLRSGCFQLTSFGSRRHPGRTSRRTASRPRRQVTRLLKGKAAIRRYARLLGGQGVSGYSLSDSLARLRSSIQTRPRASANFWGRPIVRYRSVLRVRCRRKRSRHDDSRPKSASSDCLPSARPRTPPRAGLFFVSSCGRQPPRFFRGKIIRGGVDHGKWRPRKTISSTRRTSLFRKRSARDSLTSRTPGASLFVNSTPAARRALGLRRGEARCSAGIRRLGGVALGQNPTRLGGFAKAYAAERGLGGRGSGHLQT
jgi:hypothetical protein